VVPVTEMPKTIELVWLVENVINPVFVADEALVEIAQPGWDCEFAPVSTCTVRSQPAAANRVCWVVTVIATLEGT
jgi:hypothetical protein